MTITLSEAEIKQLDGFFQEMPTKYGLPLIQFFSKLNEAQNGQQTEVKEKEVEG
tara:strand:+ start:867 stop:1028 length:162 start_codon:yes stop_codon:yes gene_type:complete